MGPGFVAWSFPSRIYLASSEDLLPPSVFQFRSAAADLCIDTKFRNGNENFNIDECIKDGKGGGEQVIYVQFLTLFFFHEIYLSMFHSGIVRHTMQMKFEGGTRI